MPRKKKEEKKEEEKEEKKDESVEEKDDDTLPLLLNLSDMMMPPEDPKPKIRKVALFGDVKEDRSAEIIYSMHVYKESGKKTSFKDPDDPESDLVETYEPFEFIVSSYGGSAVDMFAIYDSMRLIKDDCEIHTVGLGKVMSAAVLLLAAGTKGQRKVGANCRLMIHGVISGQQGHLDDLENEMEESKWMQKQYIKALAAESNMTEKYIRNLMKRRLNVYIDAKEAVELGIADSII